MNLYLIQEGTIDGHQAVLGLLTDKSIAHARARKYELPSSLWWITIHSYKELNGEFVPTKEHDPGHLDYHRDEDDEPENVDA